MAIKLNILAVAATAQTAEDLKRILADNESMELTIIRRNGHFPVRDSSMSPDVIICELLDSGDASLQSLEALLGKDRDNFSVFVIGAVDNPDWMRRLMRIGVRDVWPSPMNRQDLLTQMEQLLQEKREHTAPTAAHKKTVVAFFNAKGSCGATMLSANIATALATRHKAKIAVIDLDIQFGKVALLFDVKPQGTVLDALRETERMDAVLLKALMTAHSSGVHVLASPAGLNSLKDVQDTAVRRLIETAASLYDIVILDMPHLIAGWTIEALRDADKTFIITQNTLSAIRDTRQLLDFLGGQGLDPKAIEVVNNRAMAKSPSVSIEQMKKALKRERLHRIRNDYAAAVSSADQGKPLAKTAPQSSLSQDIDGLADYIWKIHHNGKELPTPKSSWIDKLVRRTPPASSSDA